MSSSTQTNYEVRVSARGFDVMNTKTAQIVYCSSKRSAVNAVRRALAEGHIGDREATRLPESGSAAELQALIYRDKLADLQRIANDDGVGIDEYSNDELLRLGIGYSVPGRLSDEQVRREAAEILSELEEA